MLGTIRSLYKFQLLLVNSVQAIYQSQGVNISSKHIEIIVRQMTAKVVIKQSGDTPLLPGELIRLSLINEIYQALKVSDNLLQYKTPEYEPLLLSATNSSLSKDGFYQRLVFKKRNVF
jgi:DNA-directed RNA polymerase subunit beta'